MGVKLLFDFFDKRGDGWLGLQAVLCREQPGQDLLQGTLVAFQLIQPLWQGTGGRSQFIWLVWRLQADRQETNGLDDGMDLKIIKILSFLSLNQGLSKERIGNEAVGVVG